MAYSTLFASSKAQASAYALFRPRYCDALFGTIFKCMGLQEGQKASLAVDVATGSGQALEGYAHRFERVIGVDSSLEQLEAASQLPNVEYMQGDAHALPIEDGTADLVTVAQALHWFERPRFYTDAARALKPGSGVLAVWTYDAGAVTPPGGPVDRVYQDMWRGVLGPYWAAPRLLVDEQYGKIEPMDPYFEHTERHQFPSVTDTTVDELVGYVKSFSAYATYLQQHPEAQDPIIAFRTRLEEACHVQGLTSLQLDRCFTLLLAKGPRKP